MQFEIEIKYSQWNAAQTFENVAQTQVYNAIQLMLYFRISKKTAVNIGPESALIFRKQMH